jgi:hypothetical protein
LDYVWVNDVGDDTHGAPTQWAHGKLLMQQMPVQTLSRAAGCAPNHMMANHKPMAFRILKG